MSTTRHAARCVDVQPASHRPTSGGQQRGRAGSGRPAACRTARRRRAGRRPGTAPATSRPTAARARPTGRSVQSELGAARRRGAVGRAVGGLVEWCCSWCWSSQGRREGRPTATGSTPRLSRRRVAATGTRDARLPPPVLTGSGSRVCGFPHSQRPEALPCRSPLTLHLANSGCRPRQAVGDGGREHGTRAGSTWRVSSWESDVEGDGDQRRRALGLAAKKVLATVWRKGTGNEPPANPESPDTSWGEAVAWAALLRRADRRRPHARRPQGRATTTASSPATCRRACRRSSDSTVEYRGTRADEGDAPAAAGAPVPGRRVLSPCCSWSGWSPRSRRRWSGRPTRCCRGSSAPWCERSARAVVAESCSNRSSAPLLTSSAGVRPCGYSGDPPACTRATALPRRKIAVAAAPSSATESTSSPCAPTSSVSTVVVLMTTPGADSTSPSHCSRANEPRASAAVAASSGEAKTATWRRVEAEPSSSRNRSAVPIVTASGTGTISGSVHGSRQATTSCATIDVAAERGAGERLHRLGRRGGRRARVRRRRGGAPWQRARCSRVRWGRRRPGRRSRRRAGAGRGPARRRRWCGPGGSRRHPGTPAAGPRIRRGRWRAPRRPPRRRRPRRPRGR